MPRVVSLYLPTFATDRIRRRDRAGAATAEAPTKAPGEASRPPERTPPPLVTATRDGSRRVLAAVDATARRLGLRTGLAVAHAQAALPGLTVIEATPDEDRAALGALAGWCLRYAPVVATDGPDGILVDVEGAAHLLGGEAALLADVTGRLDRAGIAVSAALAGTRGAAWALARYAPGAVVETGREAEALAGLPSEAMRLAPETVGALALLGIERIGDLARFPRAQLTLRLGPEIVRALDRALGRAPDPITPLVPPSLAQVRAAFAEPLGHLEALEAAVARLAPALCLVLERRRAGLRQLDALFRRVDGRPIGVRVGTAAPSRDSVHLARLLAERLGSVDPGFGIDEIVLAATRVERLAESQTVARAVAAGDRSGTAALAPLVDRLAVRLGAERVFRAAPVESRLPERSVRRVPALAPAAGSSWPAALPRPSRLIDPPEPVEATAVVPDEPPSFFVWRRVRYVVRGADGPERVRGEWWRADAEVASLRDYYRVEDREGRRFWLFRDAPMAQGGRWWLHGRFT